MEHRSPRLPEFTLNDFTLDVIPIDKRDLILFPIVTKSLDDEESERLLKQAVEIAGLVDDIVRFYRQLERKIRRAEKESPQDLPYQHGLRRNVFVDADIVSQYLRKHKIGRHFPYTRRRISRRISWLTSKNHFPKTPDTLSTSPLEPGETFFSLPELTQPTTSLPLRFTQPHDKIDLSVDTLKTLRAKYSKIYHKN